MKWCLVVLILAGVTRANSVETNYSIDKCPDLNSQEEIDLNEVSLLYCLSTFFFHFSPSFPIFPRLRPSSDDYVTAESCGLPARSTLPIVKIIGNRSLRLDIRQEFFHFRSVMAIPFVPFISIATIFECSRLEPEIFAGRSTPFFFYPLFLREYLNRAI